MARFLIAVIFSFVFATAAQDRAQAQTETRFFGHQAKLLYVTDANFPSREIPLALCAHVIDMHVLGLPVYRAAVGYGYAENQCHADAYEPITTATLALMRDADVLPSDVPDQPAVTLQWAWQSILIFAMAGLAILGIPLLLRHRMRRASVEAVGQSADPLFFDILLTVLYHVARIDGVIEKAEVQAINRSVKSLTAATVTPEMTAEKFTQTMRDDALFALLKTCDREERATLMEGAVSVATHARVLTREKRTFLHQLNNQLGGDPDALKERLEAEMKDPQVNMESECHRSVKVA